MPKVSDLFPSLIVRAPELDTAHTTIHILGWREKLSDGESHYVLDIDLAGVPREMRCGPMLAREIASALSEGDLDKWVGNAISIFPGKLTIKDKPTGEVKVVDVIHADATS